MIRFILKRHQVDQISGLNKTTYETVDLDIPTLEASLAGGGFSESGSQSVELIGAELIDSINEEPPLPFWEPCNPGCDPDFNGYRNRGCSCENAKTAMALGRTG
tara:strand:- start:1070 stop:1381 length:312 start_codon:yes stop_codon:yes gene_type:complete